jgi:biopolymer transport protein ExbD
MRAGSFGAGSARHQAVGHAASLNLTPMIDMMTIILVFLVKSYSVAPQYLTSTQEIQLSATTSEITAPDAPVVIIGKDGVLVDGAVVVNFKEGKPAATFLKAQTVPELLAAFKGIAAKAKKEQSKTLILQADRFVSYDTLKPILRTAGVAGFTDIKLAGRFKE